MGTNNDKVTYVRDDRRQIIITFENGNITVRYSYVTTNEILKAIQILSSNWENEKHYEEVIET